MAGGGTAQTAASRPLWHQPRSLAAAAGVAKSYSGPTARSQRKTCLPWNRRRCLTASAMLAPPLKRTRTTGPAAPAQAG
eukprot:5778764-Lingulodinium_polyedra.AAC.1